MLAGLNRFPPRFILPGNRPLGRKPQHRKRLEQGQLSLMECSYCHSAVAEADEYIEGYCSVQDCGQRAYHVEWVHYFPLAVITRTSTMLKGCVQKTAHRMTAYNVSIRPGSS